MKTKILFFSILVMIAACSRPTDKKQKLATLKQEHDKIAQQIATLEDEIRKESGTAVMGEVKNVAVAVVQPKEFNHYVEVQGKLDGEENVAVSPQTAGVVTSVKVKEGDVVKRGQVLAEMDAQVMRQGIEELKTQLRFATDVYNKQKNLWDKKIGSEMQFLTAKNNKQALEDKLATLKDQLDMTRIKSPINGTVEEIPVKVGQLASPGVPAFRVVNLSKVKISAELAEAYAPKVRTGDKVLIFFPDFNKEIPAKVSFVSKYISPVNRTFIVEARLNSGEITFKANMLAVLKINDYSAKNAITIPFNLVQKSFDKQFVYVVKDVNGKKSAEKKIITLGLNYNGQTEVTAGLSAGDNLITFGYQDLNDGQLIKF